MVATASFELNWHYQSVVTFDVVQTFDGIGEQYIPRLLRSNLVANILVKFSLLIFSSILRYEKYTMIYSQFSDVKFSSVALAALRSVSSSPPQLQELPVPGSPLTDNIVKRVLLSPKHDRCPNGIQAIIKLYELQTFEI